jgi:tetratricopeptide (TPR) repeat protein
MNFRSRLTWLIAALLIALLSPSATGLQTTTAESYSQAESLIRSGRWDDGIAILVPLVRSSPSNLKALNLLGLAFTGEGQLKYADARFEQALRLDPQFLPALKNLAINEYGLKETSAAKQHLLRACKLAPDDPVVHAYLGEIAYEQRDYHNAANHLARSGRLLSQNPEVTGWLIVSYLNVGERNESVALLQGLNIAQLSAQTQFDLGISLASRGLFPEAARSFNVLFSSYPESYNAGLNLSICYLEAKDYSQAIEVLRSLSDRKFDTAEVETLTGEAAEAEGNTQDAVAAFRKAALLDPDNEEPYLELADLCIDKDSYDLGMEVLKVGIHHNPHSARLIYQRGVLRAMHDEADLAEQDFELASQLAPDENFSYIGLGLNYIERGDLSRAIKLLRQRVQRQPRDFMLQYLLGRALVQSGASQANPSFREAQTAFEASIRINSKFAAARVELAKIYIAETRLADAVVQLQKAITVDPKNTAAYSHLAIAYRRQEKPALAKQALETLKALNDAERSQIQASIRTMKPATP